MQDPEFVRSAFAGIARRYVATNHVLSGGLDILWRRRLARLVAAEQPRTLLDLATGSGDVLWELRKVLPDAVAVGADFCPEMLAHARARGLTNLVVADGLRIPCADAAFDAVTVAFGLRNMASWPEALREMRRVLRPGGRLYVLDFSEPRCSWVRGPYGFYLHRVLPRVAGWLTGKPEAYRYLGSSIRQFPSGEAMCALLRSQGFDPVRALPLTGGIASIYVGTAR